MLKYVYTIDLYSGPVLKILDMLFKEYYEETKTIFLKQEKFVLTLPQKTLKLKMLLRKEKNIIMILTISVAYV